MPKLEAVFVRLPVDLKQRVEFHARTHGLSFAASVRLLLTQAINREDRAARRTP